MSGTISEFSGLSETPCFETRLSLPALGWSHFYQQQLTLDELEQFIPARICSVARGRLQALTEQGEQSLLLPGHWRQQYQPHQLPTVGDWVLLEPRADQLLVHRLLERKSLLRRKAAGDRVQQQLLAANVDLLLIVTSCNQDFNLSRIERYQVFAEEAGCELVVVATKADLIPPSAAAEFAAQLAAVPGIDGSCVLDARDQQQISRQLAPHLRPGMTISVVGSSGVGKSTLTNAVLGQALQDTGGIREQDSKGRHTTTARSLLPACCDGLSLCLIDTPGIRELQLSGGAQGADVFSDIVALTGRCRFADCSHRTEPGCAVQDALASGALSERRWNSYLKLREEAAHSGELLLAAEQRQRDKHQRFKHLSKNMHARRKFERRMGLKG